MKRICLLTILFSFFHGQTLAFELFPMVQFLDDAGKGTTVFSKSPIPLLLHYQWNSFQSKEKSRSTTMKPCQKPMS